MKFARSAEWQSLPLRLFSFLLCVVVACSTPVLAAEDWIDVDANGNLIYRQVHEGDRVPDFSAAGYGVAGESLPLVAKVGEVSPRRDPLTVGDDDADRIQAAIDAAGALPLNAEGFRGAIELAPGDYIINKTITVAYSGIVLRGARGPGRARLVAGAANGPMIVIAGEGKPRASEPPRKIMDAYVAVGARTLTVSAATGLSVGDHVMVQRPFTQGWISLVGMDRLPPREDGQPVKQWGPGTGIVSDRRIVAISGTTLTLDAPLTDAIAAGDGGTLWRYSFPGRISKIGLENITADGTSYQPARRAGEIVRMPRDGATFTIIDSAADVWVRDVELTNFVQPLQVGSRARDISVVDFISRSFCTALVEGAAECYQHRRSEGAGEELLCHRHEDPGLLRSILRCRAKRLLEVSSRGNRHRCRSAPALGERHSVRRRPHIGRPCRQESWKHGNRARLGRGKRGNLEQHRRGGHLAPIPAGGVSLGSRRKRGLSWRTQVRAQWWNRILVFPCRRVCSTPKFPLLLPPFQSRSQAPGRDRTLDAASHQSATSFQSAWGYPRHTSLPRKRSNSAKADRSGSHSAATASCDGSK
jgi:hypothetical protein